jgi:flagellar hook-basal body complex protein FliE
MRLPPRLALVIRRTLVTVGVAGSLVVGAVTVRAAAAWTASAAPLEAPPISASDLAGKLSDEQARSAALELQIVDLTTRTTDLATALDNATQRIGTDSTAAKTLRAQLATAQKKLAAVMKALKAASTSTTPRTTAPTPPPAGPPGGDD